MCPYLELFWSVYSRTVLMRENMDQNKFEYGHILRSARMSSEYPMYVLSASCFLGGSLNFGSFFNSIIILPTKMTFRYLKTKSFRP